MTTNCVDEILQEKLYIGDVRIFNDIELMRRLSFTHIVTVELVPVPLVITSSFPQVAVLHVPVADLPETDLLFAWMTRSTSFIENALTEDGKVLIHCYHGVSRSATLLAAYLLKDQITYREKSTKTADVSGCVDEVLTFIKSRRSIVCPNDGFMAQLKLWKAMQCRIDHSFMPYKMYQLCLIHQQIKTTKIMPNMVKSFFKTQNIEYGSKFPLNGDDHSVEATSIEVTQEHFKDRSTDGTEHRHSDAQKSDNICYKGIENTECYCVSCVHSTASVKRQNINTRPNTLGVKSARKKSCVAYRCRKCRFVLASEENIFSHSHKNCIDKGTVQITWQSMLDRCLNDRDGPGQDHHTTLSSWNYSCSNKPCDKGIFVEPMKWMGSRNESFIKGGISSEKIYCEKCNSKVGVFAWMNSVSCPCGTFMGPPGFLLQMSRVDRCSMIKDVEASI